MQQAGGNGVKLALHQPARKMHDRDVHAACLQAIGGFQAEESAADDHRVAVGGCRLDHFVGVLDIPVRNDAGQVFARDRKDEGNGPCRKQESVIGLDNAAGGLHGARLAVDAGDGLAQVQPDIVGGIPVQIVEDDLLQRLFARQDRRQQDAVVVGMRLGAEHRDVVEIRCEL